MQNSIRILESTSSYLPCHLLEYELVLACHLLEYERVLSELVSVWIAKNDHIICIQLASHTRS